jgi:hypothetical protein
MYEIVKISDSTTVASTQHGVSQRCAVQVRAVIRLPCCRKKTRETFTNNFGLFTDVLRSTLASLVTGQKLRRLPKRKRGCHTCLPQSVLLQLSVLKFYSVFMSSFPRLDASQSDYWHSVFKSAKYVLSHIRDLRYSKVCAKWVPQTLTVQHKT